MQVEKFSPRATKENNKCNGSESGVLDSHRGAVRGLSAAAAPQMGTAVGTVEGECRDVQRRSKDALLSRGFLRDACAFQGNLPLDGRLSCVG